MKKNFCAIKPRQETISGDKGVQNRGEPVALPHFSFRSIADDAQFEDPKEVSSLDTAFAKLTIVKPTAVKATPKKIMALVGKAQIRPEHPSLFFKGIAPNPKAHRTHPEPTPRSIRPKHTPKSPISAHEVTPNTTDRKQKRKSEQDNGPITKTKHARNRYYLFNQNEKQHHTSLEQIPYWSSRK
tara:strand:+ start:199 stop:750 length:552 start_codon:yes stop_codon:yes gene_type:complete